MEVKSRAALLSILSNSLLTTLKLFVGIFTNSVSILSEAIHSGLDLVASLIAFFAIRIANKPADEDHHFGHGKYENVSGTIEALLIFVAALWIIYESLHKFFQGGQMQGFSLGIIVMGISALLNYIVSSHLYKVSISEDSIALEADALHLRTDVYTSLGVLLGIVIMYFTKWFFIDPLIAIIVALFIMKEAIEITKRAFNPLVDSSLDEEEEQAIREILIQHSASFIEFHSLRTRKSGSEIHIDLHLVVPKKWSIEKVHAVCSEIEENLKTKYTYCHCLIHAEPCTDVIMKNEDCNSSEGKGCPYLGKMKKD
ncbi:cation diffusion facilitator family transporter [Desulfonispora thiosulfatigenes DSM 11270]|uniref:Cation diffusion facilitator family transporter n=1 Tax=Desulfonispora thiosulfatigenes DSM 11270 TaxID=656914 RepID=A0A1W1VQN2_DESTI|nr:cation diffusion facilitator family transporter [Desulfonispora thiosulfatigenes]SMB95692.1 cation diffusion facilitator family transporter [Desulfonispora thiosulfatigenes DSM 11270]